MWSNRDKLKILHPFKHRTYSEEHAINGYIEENKARNVLCKAEG